MKSENNKVRLAKRVQDLEVYKLAFETAMIIFVNKLLDAAQEAAEIQTWLEFALQCNYITMEVYEELYERYEHIFAMLNTMENKANAFCNVK